METIFKLIFLGLILWGISRGVVILSILFLLTPNYCKVNSIHLTTKHPAETVFRWTGILIVLCFLWEIKSTIVMGVVSASMVAAALKSLSIRRTVRLKIKNQPE